MRVKLTPVFSSGKIKQMFPLMEKIGRDLRTYLLKLKDPKTNSFVVNSKDIAAYYGIDVIASIAYGKKINSLSIRNISVNLLFLIRR